VIEEMAYNKLLLINQLFISLEDKHLTFNHVYTKRW